MDARRANIDGFLSDEQPITSGVPQGSVLSALLFLIYIDDLIPVPEYSQVYCFADDTKFFYAVEIRFLEMYRKT